VFDLLDGHPTVGDPLDVACYWILLAAIVIAVVAPHGSAPSWTRST
jgi:hypothetical protein